LSNRAEEIFGWNLQQFKDQQGTGYNQVYKEDQPRVFKMLKQLIDGTVARNNIRHRNYTREGRVIWCEWLIRH